MSDIGGRASVPPFPASYRASGLWLYAIAPLQDLLNLGREARMNVPGRADGN